MKHNTFFATFGGNHALANYCIGFVCKEGIEGARSAMMEMFGDKWGFMYCAGRDANNGVGKFISEWQDQHQRFGITPIMCFEVYYYPYNTLPTVKLISTERWAEEVFTDAHSSDIELDYVRTDTDRSLVIYRQLNNKGKMFAFKVNREGFEMFTYKGGEIDSKVSHHGYVIPRVHTDSLSDKLTQLLREEELAGFEERHRLSA
jgi:hypothetical protein